MCVLSVAREQLSIIGDFQFPSSNEQCLAYISDIITINCHPYRLIYLPPNKTEPESVSHITELLRSLSDLVISDASSGLSSMRLKK